MTTGEKIRSLRIAQGITVDLLAEKLGKNRATVYRYENGEIENMPINILKPIAEALHTTPAYLMGWDYNQNHEYSLPEAVEMFMSMVNSEQSDFIIKTKNSRGSYLLMFTPSDESDYNLIAAAYTALALLPINIKIAITDTINKYVNNHFKR
jgi:transcriptional regulator with XRE-family HTH domain